MALTDLNAELIRIRDLRSRAYFADALKSYHAGALRAAIASTWTAVAFDLILKYRELAGLQDAEAQRYITSWDNAVTAQDVAALLKLERNLLTHASAHMALIDANGKRTLDRLFEDRHLCSHPAFVSQTELFEPSEELVRAHLVAAVDLVLGQPPVQGRAFFEMFSIDLQSPGFPIDPQTTYDYVEQKYLARMRPNVIKSFGTILAKSMVRNVPPEWQPFQAKVVNTLGALERRRQIDWPEILQSMARLINDDHPGDRPRVFAVIANFPGVEALLEQPALTALDNLLVNTPDLSALPEVFAGASNGRFSQLLVRRFAELPSASAAAVLAHSATAELWPQALGRYGASASFRGAEGNFVSFIAPFVNELDQARLNELLTTVAGNGQIWSAAGTPGQLASVFTARPLVNPGQAEMTALFRHRSVRNDQGYAPLWGTAQARGWVMPTAAQLREMDLADDA